MKFSPGCTLRANPGSGDLPSHLLELFPKLNTLALIHYGDTSKLVTAIEQMGGDFKTVEKMESSGYQLIDQAVIS